MKLGLLGRRNEDKNTDLCLELSVHIHIQFVWIQRRKEKKSRCFNELVP